MSRSIAKNTGATSVKKAKYVGAQEDELNANQVIESVFLLFNKLGISVPARIRDARLMLSSRSAAHTLYPHTSAIGNLLKIWHQEPDYLDNAGNPARIRLSGRRPSFQILAQRAIPSIDRSFLLSELERLGAISIDEGKFVRLHMRSIPMYEDKRLAVQHTLSTLNGFIKTLCHNLEVSNSNSNQLFHRIAWTSDFNKREIQALKVRVKRHGQNFLESCEDWIMQKSLPKSSKSNHGLQSAKVSVGVYLSIEDKEA